MSEFVFGKPKVKGLICTASHCTQLPNGLIVDQDGDIPSHDATATVERPNGHWDGSAACDDESHIAFAMTTFIDEAAHHQPD